MTDEELSQFYLDKTQNPYDVLQHQYLIIKNADGYVVDRQVWTGTEFEGLKFQAFRSTYLGDVRPKKDDTYQMLAADSFLRNKITLIKGPAGTGKTFMSLAFLLNQLEYHRIDKIIIFCNTVATKNSARLGFYPGTRDEKLLDSQIGNLLSSKLGDKTQVERMIAEGKLILLPLSDIRGYDTSGMRAGIYISEAQNLDVSLMKLALQRIGEDSVCIIDGDEKTQVDDISFAGNNNGMRRASKIFRGHNVYGEVELKNIHRSRIAQIAEKM
jgi:predicted ribonuclease YlaK